MIKIRAHHLLCIPRFKGGSYNKEMGDKIFEIQKEIKKNPRIKIVHECDDICEACPHLKDDKCFRNEGINKHVQNQDALVLKKLSINKDKIVRAKDIISLSISKIGEKELKQICRGCEFLNPCLKYGSNKSFIGKLK